MSTYNKLFTGFVLAALVLVMGHTAAWAINSSRALDEAQAGEVAPVIATTATGSMRLATADATDSCAKATHAVAH